MEGVHQESKDLRLTVVIFGASGDLAKRKTFPTFFTLYCHGLIPKEMRIIGYARSKFADGELQERIKPFLKGGTDQEIDSFLSRFDYIQGAYDGADGYKQLQRVLRERESAAVGSARIGRLYYLALPPSVYVAVIKGLKEHADVTVDGERSWLRLVIEKPFGRDLETSESLAAELGECYPEEQVYRIDHYLGKEVVRNFLFTRFFNTFLSPCWSREHISNVQITFKEPFGMRGRGGYFDEFGIIRDVMQNHLMQVLALIAMERPVTFGADDIRDEKVKLLRCVQPIVKEDVVIGQYTAASGQPGYLEDAGVPAASRTPTFALCVLRIKNERWHGVPFIIKAGKALNEHKSEVRVQFKSPVEVPGTNMQMDKIRNELVFRLQPDEAIYLKMALKEPGLGMTPIISELDLTYRARHGDLAIPEAYERLILDVIDGQQQNFVRRDELRAAWAIFTPLLKAIDRAELPLLQYPVGSRGPVAADIMIAKEGFVRNEGYLWHRQWYSSL